MSVYLSSEALANISLLSVPVNDKYYDDFVSKLSIEKIKKFSEDSKAKHLDIKGIKKEMRFPKKAFLSLLKSIFGSSELFTPIYEQIFSRFKAIKCEVKCPNHRTESYFISRVIPEEEIDIYEVSCALACFVKCDVKEKLHLLFDLTDRDDDGYINQNEVKKIIFSINSLFCNEEGQMETNSNVISQSMGSIRAQQSYTLLMKYPGDLSKSIHEDHYVDFNQFYSAIQKVATYKFSIIPLFVNFKECLMTKRTEEEIAIRQKNYQDYSAVTTEIVSVLKNGTEMNKTNTDFKKYLELKSELKKFRNNKQTTMKFDRKKIRLQTKQSIDLKESYLFRKGVLTVPNKEDTYEIGYNKIGSLETFPGKIKLIDSSKSDVNSLDKLPMIFKGFLSNKKSSYLTFNEIISEINVLSNKHKNEELGTEMLINIAEKINHTAFKTKKFFRNPNPFQNLTIGKFVKDEKIRK